MVLGSLQENPHPGLSSDSQEWRIWFKPRGYLGVVAGLLLKFQAVDLD